MNLSPQQKAVMSWASSGSGHLNLAARAGTGKTTTLIELCKRIEGTAFLGAFNKKIAEEIKLRLADAGVESSKTSSTMHAAGFGAWKRVSPSCEVEESKVFNICKSLNIERTRIGTICKAVSLAKQHLFAANVAPASWEYLWDQFELEVDLPFGESVVEDCRKVLSASIAQDDSIIDFDDMLYAPVMHEARIPSYDWVLIDEAQDTNAARRELAIRMLNGSGRLVAVGDECQPEGTMVEKVIKSGKFQVKERVSVPIESLELGDYVSSFSFKDHRVYARRVLGITERVHVGAMINCTTQDGRKSLYTPNHHCIARLKAKGFCTYMMQRGKSFRLGVSTLSHIGVGAGPLTRLRSEDADAVWILDTYPTKREALCAEASISAVYRIPQLMFTAKQSAGCLFTQEQLDSIWGKIDNQKDAAKCLNAFGRMREYPYFKRGQLNGTFRRPHVVQACNLLKHSEMLGRDIKWVEISAIRRTGFITKVYSLSIDKEKNYFADGLLTHNCQAIYGFTGADADAMKLIKDQLGSVDLPLNVTYRCPQAVVRLAQSWVPDIQAAPGSPEGKVVTLKESAFSMSLPKDQDVILCRNTKPLLELAYTAIRQGRGVRVEGREIGRGLLKLAQRFKEDRLREIQPRLENYRLEEVNRLREKGKLNQITAVEDKCECLSLMISQTLESGGQFLAHLEKRIESLFGDTYGKQSLLTLSTIHKSKGREWPTVWLWGRNRYQPSYYAKLSWDRGIQWPLGQERNLCYVAVTRAKSTLAEIEVDVPFRKVP